jgi:hypothetical protein
MLGSCRRLNHARCPPPFPDARRDLVAPGGLAAGGRGATPVPVRGLSGGLPEDRPRHLHPGPAGPPAPGLPAGRLLAARGVPVHRPLPGRQRRLRAAECYHAPGSPVPHCRVVGCAKWQELDPGGGGCEWIDLCQEDHDGEASRLCYNNASCLNNENPDVDDPTGCRCEPCPAGSVDEGGGPPGHACPDIDECATNNGGCTADPFWGS